MEDKGSDTIIRQSVLSTKRKRRPLRTEITKLRVIDRRKNSYHLSNQARGRLTIDYAM